MRRKRISERKDSTVMTRVHENRNCTEDYGNSNGRLSSSMSVQPEMNTYQDKSVDFIGGERNFLRQCTGDSRYPRRSNCDTIISTDYQSSTSEIDSYMSTLDIITQDEPKPSDPQYFAANTTFHGISHIGAPETSQIRRGIWALMFMSSFFLLIYHAQDRYSYYMSSPHVTKLDELSASQLVYPSITICNVNQFRYSKITVDDFYNYGKDILAVFKNKSGNSFELEDNIKNILKNDTEKLKTRLQTILENQTAFRAQQEKNMTKFYSRVGHQLWDIVKFCRFQSKNCSTDNRWRTVYTRYGKCYTFNDMEPFLKTTKGGIDNGLELILDSQQDEYMPVWKETDEISLEAGFKIQIHAQNEPPFIHELGFGISPGFQTLVATQEQRITFLPEPWGNCREDPDAIERKYYNIYSISACRIACEAEWIFNKCGCVMVHMPRVDGRPLCSPELYKMCADRELDLLTSGNNSACTCETPCEVIRYNLELSNLRFPSEQARSYLAYKYNKSEEYVKTNYLKLNIFFEALNYETIEQKVAYEVPGLFGDIGGQMGLFIGASILTILELFDYFYEVIKEKIWGKKDDEEHDKTNDDNDTHGCTSILPSVNSAPPEYQSTKPISGNMGNKGSVISGPVVNNKQQVYGTNTRLTTNSSGQYQGVGNFLMTLKEDPHHPNSNLPEYKISNYEDHMIHNGGGKITTHRRNNNQYHMARETSMSYNDLYRANNDYSSSTLPPEVSGVCGIGYITSSRTGGKYSYMASTEGKNSTAPYPHPIMAGALSSSCLNSLTNPRRNHKSAFSSSSVPPPPPLNNHSTTSFIHNPPPPMQPDYDVTNTADYPLPMETDIH